MSPARRDPYRVVEAFYDWRAREATRELDASRGIYHPVPPAITADRERMEEELARTGAESLRGRVLDAGCGNGTILTRVLRRLTTARFVGIDISHGMLQRAHARTQREPAVQGFVQGNLVALPFASSSFDGIACLEVVLHLPSKDAIGGALAELSRVLRPGGVLVITMLSNVLSLRGGFIKLVLRPMRRNEPDLFGLHSSVWLLGELRRQGFRVEWYRGWDRLVVNKRRLYWVWPPTDRDRLHRELSRIFPALHLLRDRIVFPYVKVG